MYYICWNIFIFNLTAVMSHFELFKNLTKNPPLNKLHSYAHVKI